MTQISCSKYTCITKTTQHLKNLALLFCNQISINNASSPCLWFTWLSAGCLSGCSPASSAQFPSSSIERRQEHSKAMVSLAITRKTYRKILLPCSLPENHQITFFKIQGKITLKHTVTEMTSDQTLKVTSIQ